MSEAWERAQVVQRDYWERRCAWRDLPADHFVASWQRLLAPLGLSLDAFEGQSVLDVGCGPAGIIYFIHGARCVGLDPLADLYQRWNGRFGRRIHLVRGQGERIPHGTGTFDSVVCVNCLQYARSPADVIAECARVLKPGGRLVIYVDFDSPLRKLHKVLKRRARVGQPQALSYAWLRDELRRAGVTTHATAQDPSIFRATWKQACPSRTGTA